MQLTDATAIVTGAASGFGLALTQHLHAAGAKVAAFDIDEAGLERLAAACPGVVPIVCDVSDADAVDAAVAQATEALGGIQVLVNNAGIMRSTPLINIMKRDEGRRHSAAEWDQVIATNLSAVFYMTRAVADEMMRSRTPGVVVNISSIAARGNAGQTAYAAAKAGVETMTVTWAKEFGRFGIRCAAVAPGFMDTSGTADALEAERLSKWVEQVPLRRLGTVDEVVQAISFVIENDFYNGRVIELDGGLRL